MEAELWLEQLKQKTIQNIKLQETMNNVKSEEYIRMYSLIMTKM